MGLELFPNKMNSTSASNHHKLLKYLRIIFLLVLTAIIVFNFVSIHLNLRSMVFWSIVFSFLFELLAVILEFAHNTELDRAASILFLISWSFNTVVFGSVIYLISFFGLPLFTWQSLIFFSPWLVLFVDFLLNKISYIRFQYIFPLAVSCFFFFYWLEDFDTLAFLLGPTNYCLFQIALVVAGIVVLEISRLIKVRSCSENDVEQALI